MHSSGMQAPQQQIVGTSHHPCSDFGHSLPKISAEQHTWFLAHSGRLNQPDSLKNTQESHRSTVPPGFYDTYPLRLKICGNFQLVVGKAANYDPLALKSRFSFRFERSLIPPKHARACTNARTPACTHARTRASTPARTHSQTHTRTYTQ